MPVACTQCTDLVGIIFFCYLLLPLVIELFVYVYCSHSNLTTFELRTFSADSKLVEFFHVPVVEFEPKVYTISTTCLHPLATGTTN